MFSWDLEGMADATPVVETATQAVFNNSADHEIYTFTGKGFTYDHGQPTGGIITGFELQTDEATNFTLSGFKLKVTDLLGYVQEGDVQGLMSQVFGGDDNVKGSVLNDALGGYDGDDAINGGKGDDYIRGGQGADTLTGSKGADTFAYLSLSESGGEQIDTITDLVKADFIDLSAIDANSGKAGDQAFKLVDAFTHTAGQIVLVYDEGHDRTELQMDVDGDAVADGTIYLSGDQSAFHHFVL